MKLFTPIKPIKPIKPTTPIKPIKPIILTAEEGSSLSSGSLRLYALSSSPSKLEGVAARSGLTGACASGEVVGAIDLYAYDPLNRRAAVGIMVSTGHRRQGYGLAMLRELDIMATNTFQLHQIYADIASINTASIELFKKAGYTQCGHFKEWLEYDSHFIDNIRMQLILGTKKLEVRSKKLELRTKK